MTFHSNNYALILYCETHIGIQNSKKKKSSSKVHCLETKTENYLLIRVLFRCVIKQMKNIFTSIMYITVEISKFQIEQVVNIYRKGYPKSNSNAKCSDNKDSAHKILGLWFFFILLPS